MDESNPEHVFALHSYLNREQYGDRPLGHGQYFNAEMTKTEEGAAIYYPAADKYEIADHKRIPVYDKKLSGLFPRMYSNQPHHKKEYKNWSGAKGVRKNQRRTELQVLLGLPDGFHVLALFHVEFRWETERHSGSW